MPRRKFNGIAGLSVLDDSGTRCPGYDNQISSRTLPAGLQKETPPQPRTTDVSSFGWAFRCCLRPGNRTPPFGGPGLSDALPTGLGVRGAEESCHL